MIFCLPSATASSSDATDTSSKSTTEEGRGLTVLLTYIDTLAPGTFSVSAPSLSRPASSSESKGGYTYGEPYDPLSVPQLTHEDRQHAIHKYDLQFGEGVGVFSARMGNPGIEITFNIQSSAALDRLARDAAAGDRYAIKLVRAITSYKLWGHF